jgi:hypothetical protein
VSKKERKEQARNKELRVNKSTELSTHIEAFKSSCPRGQKRKGEKPITVGGLEIIV